MVFWLIAAALLAFILFLLLQAMVASPQAVSAVEEDVAFFKAQDAEIDRQLAAGMMDEADARNAKAEAARRLLALTRQAAPVEQADARRVRMARIAVAIALPALTLPIYFKLGAPDLPAQPYASRTDLNRGQADLARMIERLEAHLASSPDDAKAHELAFPVFMRIGRYDSALASAQRLIELQGPSAERFTSLAEAAMFAAQGEVTAEVRAALDKALELDPKLPRARFYDGVAAMQDGQRDKALSILKALEADLPDGTEKRAVAAQIARMSEPPASAEDALRAQPKEQQDQSIRAMVDGLESRLSASGGNSEEWLKLVRALGVLGEKQRAAAALKSARTALAADASALSALTEIARQYSLEQGAQP